MKTLLKFLDGIQCPVCKEFLVRPNKEYTAMECHNCGTQGTRKFFTESDFTCQIKKEDVVESK